MTSAAPRPAVRAAAALEAADLADVQQAARLLVAHPLITESYPNAGALVLIRRWELVLRHEFERVLGYRLDVDRSCARLFRRPVSLAANRGASTATGRPLGPLAGSFLCLTLAATESLGEQTTASQIAEEIKRLAAGDDQLSIDLTRFDQRKAFVDALKWLEARGVLVLRDGEADRWLREDGEADALYDLSADVISRLLISSPSVLRDVHTVTDFLIEPAPSDDGQNERRLRHRLGRRLLTEPVVSFEDLPPDELAHLRHRRSRIVIDLQRLFGATVEYRAEGMLVIDEGDLSAVAFPGTGTVAQAALLWGERLVAVEPTATEVPTPVTSDAGAAWTAIDEQTAQGAWDEVVENYRKRFKAEYRENPDALRREVERLLTRLGLLRRDPDHGLHTHAALARYRAMTRSTSSPHAPTPTTQNDLWESSP